MDCEKIINLIVDNGITDSFYNDDNIKQHLESCESCRKRLEYEKMLLNTFNSIALEEPPIEVPKKVLAISNNGINTTSLTNKIIALFSSFRFKASFASLSIAFLIAFVITSHNNPELIQKTLPSRESETRAKKPSSLAFNRHQQPYISSQHKKANKNKRLKPSKRRIEKMITQPMYSIMEKSQICFTNNDKKIKLSDKIIEENTQASKSQEIANILKTYNLKIKGFIDLKNLLMQGRISSNTYNKLIPPAGYAWYSERNANNQLKVSLKKYK